MKSIQALFTPANRRRTLLILFVIVVGLGMTLFYGTRAMSSFRQMQYIRAMGLDKGDASAESLRPWMTLRFVAVAYAVPEEYLYAQLGIPFERRNANRSLGDLNRDYGLGQSAIGPYPAIIDKAKAAILEYRLNPVATGLREDVRPWMSVRYVSNSTGVPADYIFAQIGVPADGNQNKPLEMLSDQLKLPGGPRALADSVQRAITMYEAKP